MKKTLKYFLAIIVAVSLLSFHMIAQSDSSRTNLQERNKLLEALKKGYSLEKLDFGNYSPKGRRGFDGSKGFTKEELDSIDNVMRQRKLKYKKDSPNKTVQPDTSTGGDEINSVRQKRKLIRENFSNRNYGESMIAVSPTNPNNFVSGYLEELSSTSIRMRGSYTLDNGNNWFSSDIPWLTYSNQSDPVVAFDANGRSHYCYMDFKDDPNDKRNAIIVAHSFNSGSTWSDSNHVINDRNVSTIVFNDKPWVTCDQSNSSYRNSTYVVWTRGLLPSMAASQLYFSYKRENDPHFSERIEVSNGTTSPIITQGGNVVVGGDGTVYVFWLQYSIQGNQTGSLWMNRSTNGGVTFVGPSQLTGLGEVWNAQSHVLGGNFFRAPSFPYATTVPLQLKLDL